MKWFVRVIEYNTRKVERKFGPFDSEREADRADAGLQINLDHDRFYTEIRASRVPDSLRKETPGE